MEHVQVNRASFLDPRRQEAQAKRQEKKREGRPAPYSFRSHGKTRPSAERADSGKRFVVGANPSPSPVQVPLSHKACTEVRFNRPGYTTPTVTDIWSREYNQSARKFVEEFLRDSTPPKMTPARSQKLLQGFEDDLLKEFFRVAPEQMVDFLFLIRSDSQWLQRLLSRLDNPPQEKALMHLVAACKYKNRPQHTLTELQNAVLSGWSHPLPYLKLIAFHVTRGEKEKAYHIFEMYRLNVIFHKAWNNCRNQYAGVDAWHSTEMNRLESLFEEHLSQLENLPGRFLPTEARLSAALGYWPDEQKKNAETLLFDQTLRCPWNMHEPILKFTEAVIDRNLDRWAHEGSLEHKTEQIINYINSAYAKRSLEQLFRRLSDMLVALGEQDAAVENLHSFIDGYYGGPWSYTNYDQGLFLHACSIELMRNNISVQSYTQDESRRLIENICANGNEKQFILHMHTMRFLSKEILEQTDSRLVAEKKQCLTRLWNNIPSLQNYSSAGPLSGYFSLTCLAGLQEAQRQGFFEEELPAREFLSSSVYPRIEKSCRQKLQLFNNAARTNNPLAFAAIYNTSVGIIDKKPVNERNGQALTLLLAHKWLRDNNCGLSPLTLEQAKTVVDNYSGSRHVYNQLLRMCLEYGSFFDLRAGENLTQGIARLLNEVVPGACHTVVCRTESAPEATQASTKNGETEIKPRRALAAIKDAGLKTDSPPRSASEIIPNQWIII